MYLRALIIPISECAACDLLRAEHDRCELAYASVIDLLNDSEGAEPASECMKFRAAGDEARLDFSVARMELEYHRCSMPHGSTRGRSKYNHGLR